MIHGLIGALLGSALTFLLGWAVLTVQHNTRRIEPLMGEQYFLDGRLVTVLSCDHYAVEIRVPDGGRQNIMRGYWHQRSRPAAAEPERLLRREAERVWTRLSLEDLKEAEEDRHYEAVHMRPRPNA